MTAASTKGRRRTSRAGFDQGRRRDPCQADRRGRGDQAACRDAEDEADEKEEGERSATPFWRYSDDQPRAPDGKFGSGGVSAAKKILAGFKEQYDKITALPVLKQLRQGGDYVKGLTKQLYTGLEGRYGRPAAIAIMASGQALGWGTTAAGIALHIPLVLPGASLWGSLPAVAVAETIQQAHRGIGKVKAKLGALKRDDGPSEAEVEKLAAELVKEIGGKLLAWVVEHKQEILDAAKDAES